MWRIILAAFVGVIHEGLDATESLCSVYDPFKVQPDNVKFQIGGIFPLHDVNCKKLLPDTVQEVIAIQWALTHWNQNPANHHSKLGLYAADTCSRAQETVSQTLRFLDTVGYHEPRECRTENPKAKLLGLIAPKDFNSAKSMGTVLTTAELPIAAYTSNSVDALLEIGVHNVIATTPTIHVYVDVLIRLMSSLHSNLVTIVRNDDYSNQLVERVMNQLNEAGIFVSDVVDIEHPQLAYALENGDSSIIVSLLSPEEVLSSVARKNNFTNLIYHKEIGRQIDATADFVTYKNDDEILILSLNNPSIYGMDKLWISLPIDGRVLDSSEQSELLASGAKIEVIIIQSQSNETKHFRNYFLRVLKNNYHNFQLFTSYVQQVYNCSDIKCDVEKQETEQRFSSTLSIEAVIRMAYAFAAVGHKIASDAEKQKKCTHPAPECTSLIIREFLALDYQFGINDPSEFIGKRLNFYRDRENITLASGMTVVARELSISNGKFTDHQMMSYTTGQQPTVTLSSMRRADQRKRSLCNPYRPFCGQCQNVELVNSERYYLSIPRHYPMYLIGLFDFHSGSSCQTMSTTDISLPMAFIHAVWTFKQRFSDMILLKNFDFGALLVDSCSSGKQAIEIVVTAETQCIRFNHADRNITIVPGSALGYVSALHESTEEALKGYFSSEDSDATLVTVDSDSTPRHAYSAFPSAINQALALLKFIKRMRWQFVSVALNEQHTESLVIFRHFERLALDRGVCLGEVVNIGKIRVENRSFSTTTNVTIVFATALDASAYLSLTLRSHRNVVHVMMGDAHDWYLHNPENTKHFKGIFSIQPKDIIHEDFLEWAKTITPLTLPESWFWSYIENHWQCALTQKNKLTYGKMCSGDEQLNLSSLGRMTKAGYLTRGVERFLFAVDSVYKKLCPSQAGLCLDFYENGRRMISSQMMKTTIENEIDIYEYSYTKDNQHQYRTIGNWSLKGGLQLDTLFRNFFNESIKSSCQPPVCKCIIDGDYFQHPLDSFLAKSEHVDIDQSTESYVKREPTFGFEKVAYKSVFEHLSIGQWRHNTYNFFFLFLITALTMIAIAVLVLVLVKMYLRVVKGNQSLGISLLIGIIILYTTAYFFIFDATDVVCRLRLAMHGFGYSLCFGVMIAKATQLRNAEALGFSTTLHISFWNYWLLLFFIIGVQIALNTRWMTESFMSTLAVLETRSEMVCMMSREEFVLANIYVMILLFLTLFINSMNRNIKRNYKETKWLFVSSVLCTLIWLSWVPTYIIISNDLKEKVIVVELICCASVLLGLLFGPKIYILLSYEPVLVVYKENQTTNGMALFEKARAVSPASSTGSSTRSTTATNSSQMFHGTSYNKEQLPIFHTIMRKKNKVRRSQSEHDSEHEMRHEAHDCSDVVIVQTSPKCVSRGLNES